jgi:hypothetical protein
LFLPPFDGKQKRKKKKRKKEKKKERKEESLRRLLGIFPNHCKQNKALKIQAIAQCIKILRQNFISGIKPRNSEFTTSIYSATGSLVRFENKYSLLL